LEFEWAIWKRRHGKNGIWPVSYTHLDVYKRQVLGFPGTSAEADFNLRSVENFCEIVRHPTSDFLSHHLVTLVTQTMAAGIGPAYADLGGRLRSGGGAAAVLTAIEKRL